MATCGSSVITTCKMDSKRISLVNCETRAGVYTADTLRIVMQMGVKNLHKGVGRPDLHQLAADRQNRSLAAFVCVRVYVCDTKICVSLNVGLHDL